MTQIFNDVMWSNEPNAHSTMFKDDKRPADEGKRSTIPGPAKPAVLKTPEASPTSSPSLSERSHDDLVPYLEETSVEEVSGLDEDVSGISSLADISEASVVCSVSSSSTDWNGPGPIPMDDSVEVFLAKCLSEGDIVNVSTSDDCEDNLGKGQASVPELMET